MAFKKKETPKSKLLEVSEKTEQKKTNSKLTYIAPTPTNMEKETKAEGKTAFISFIEGEHINLREAIAAKCYDCMAYYVDGIGDCGCPDCPLYPFHPYNPNPAKLRKERPDMRKKK